VQTSDVSCSSPSDNTCGHATPNSCSPAGGRWGHIVDVALDVTLAHHSTKQGHMNLSHCCVPSLKQRPVGGQVPISASPGSQLAVGDRASGSTHPIGDIVADGGERRPR
jgi:hypothetical protein